jgi:hypothetical protein
LSPTTKVGDEWKNVNIRKKFITKGSVRVLELVVGKQGLEIEVWRRWTAMWLEDHQPWK